MSFQSPCSSLTELAWKCAIDARLRWLEHKYGLLPSILATRADFVKNKTRKATLLIAAYRIARKRRDRRNLAYITHSLAEHFVQAKQSPSDSRHWLKSFKKHISDDDDPQWARREYARLKRIFAVSLS